MTAAELIASLQRLPPDCPVTIGTPMGDYPRVLQVDVASADEGEVAYIEVE